MKNLISILISALITTQSLAAIITNNPAREIPNQIAVSASCASYTVGAVTFQTTPTNTVTLNGHALSAGQAVAFGTITTTTGISTGTTYYVINPTANTFQLASTPGGSALTLTTNGTGILSTSYYAIVKAQVLQGGTFSLNATVALSSYTNTWTVLSTSSLTTSNLNNALVDTGTSSSSGGPAAFGTTTAHDDSSTSQVFKIPVGTVVVGSGTCKYSLELYNI